MPPRSARHAVLSEVSPFGDDGDIRVVIETPRGSRSKYSYDPECDCMQLSTVLPEGMVFPYDFGFVPATLGGDGDPLDVLVLMDEPAFAGCLVRTRLVGVIEAEQTERDGETERNDRLIGVAAKSRLHTRVRTLESLGPALLEEIEHFFASYNQIKGKEFKPLARSGPERARELVEEGMRQFRRSKSKKSSSKKSKKR